MEEADALCSRVGIMVKGELRFVVALKESSENNLNSFLDVSDQRSTWRTFTELATILR